MYKNGSDRSNLSITVENDSGPYVLDSPDITNWPLVQALFYVFYTTVFVVGLFGNVLVCFVVLRNKAMQSVTNFFITNLALSDILLCMLAVPFTPLYTFMEQWIFGSFLCHLLPFSQGVSVYISTLTLTSIAVDRFFVIIYPFKERMRLSTSVAIIVSIWVFSILATLPYGILMNLVFDEKYYCEEDWPSEESRRAFGMATTVLQFVIPFIIMSLCYIKVSLKLSDRAKLKPGVKSSRREEQERERKRRTNLMLIAMVAIFGFSWLPLNLINLVQDVNREASAWQYSKLCFFIAHAIAMSSTCYNPFVYAWLNENFRKEFKQVLPCFVAMGPAGGSGSTRSRNGRISTFRMEKTCNGNEAMHETLLPPLRSSSVRAHHHHPSLTDNCTTTTVVYSTATDTVSIPLNASENVNE